MTKVKLHIKAAKALDKLKIQGLNDKDIMRAVLESDGNPDSALEFADFEEILRALADGYEVKESPEKAILRYYDNAKHAVWEADETDDLRTVDIESARKEAVEFVLDELGVKIEGINK